MNKFQPHINVAYPPNNEIIFEEWMLAVVGDQEIHGRQMVPVNFTGYHVNNSYGNDKGAIEELQSFVNDLDRSKKWFSVCQYDDSVIIDFKDLNVIRFEMSKNIGIPMPLLCQPHPFRFDLDRRLFANFIGSMTHPFRGYARDYLSRQDGYCISFIQHDIENYCRILASSVFTLCYRGYGANSFRIAEAIQYGSIPVYISDEFVWPEKIVPFPGIKIDRNDISFTDQILKAVSPSKIIDMQGRLKEIYEMYLTYNGAFENIIKLVLKNAETQHNSW